MRRVGFPFILLKLRTSKIFYIPKVLALCQWKHLLYAHYTPTEIAAKDTLHIESGKDTNILGSTVQGDKVTAKIGGNLNIETLQEKETYE